MRSALLLCGLLSASAAQAQDATLKAAQGEVFLRAYGEGDWHPARAGAPMLFGDSVRTGKDGIAHIQLEEGRAILLQANSEMRLLGNPYAAIFDFKVGEFLMGLKRKLEAGQTYRVRVPAAVAAVRGTLFWGKSDESGKATFAGFGGKVSVTAKGKTVPLAPGQIVTIDAGDYPSKPAPHSIPRGYLKTFAVDESLQGLDSLVDEKIK